MLFPRLNWLEIDTKKYARNIKNIKQLVGPSVKIMAVVKANAYGHGAIELSKHCQTLRVDYLGVVCLYEARQLRDAGVTLPILILNYIDPDGACAALDLGVTVNVMDETVLRALNAYAQKKNKIAKIHVKIDSGMHRAGLQPSEIQSFFSTIQQCNHVTIEGVFTHFATSDEKGDSFVMEQNHVFQNCISDLKKMGIHPPLIHAANSGATLRFPDTHNTMVRPGIITYGLSPTGIPPQTEFAFPFKLEPILSWKTKVVQIRTISKGESVGYGRTFIAQKDTIVGLLPVGYADGFRRGPTNWGHVLVSGEKAPLLGRVSMDQTSIDLTQIKNVRIGDEVVLIGTQGKQSLSAESIGASIGTINYEVTSSIAARVHRICI